MHNFETPTIRPISIPLRMGISIDRSVEVSNLSESPTKVGSKTGTLLKIRSSISTNTRTVSWILRSSGRRKSIVSYLFHKWLFSELTRKEWEFFSDLRESTSEDMIFAALRARNLGFSKKKIRKALRYSSSLLWNRRPPTKESWVGYRSFFLDIEREERHSTERKLPKYTGWRRHQNDQGSLSPPKEDPFFLEPLDENDTIAYFLEIVKKLDLDSRVIIINNLRITL